jgi:hypothetical protein
MIRALAVLSVLAATSVAAQGVFNARSAQRQLFNGGRAELIVHPYPGMSEAEEGAFKAVADQLVRSVPFYGAIAISPQEGMNSQATTARGNYHSFESAAAAVLADCNRARARGTAPCVVAAEIRPRNWRARELQLSSSATAAFRASYRRARGEKSFAVSPTSGGFGIGMGPGAASSAVAACNQAGGVGDCRVIIQD